MTWHLLAPSIAIANLGQLAWYGNPTGYMWNIYMFLGVAAVVQWWRK